MKIALVLSLLLCGVFLFAATPSQGAQGIGAGDHVLGGTLQFNLFSLKSTADYEVKSGDAKATGDGDFDEDLGVGFGIIYMYVSPKSYFLGGELVFHNRSGNMNGEINSDWPNDHSDGYWFHDHSGNVDENFDLDMTRIVFNAGYYFSPEPLRPYIQGGLSINMEKLDLEDGGEDSATIFGLHAGGGVDYYSGHLLIGGGGKLEYFINEEFNITTNYDVKSTITISRIPLVIFGRIGYRF